MSNNDDLSDLPELEDMGDTDTSIIVDKQRLSIGDPNKEIDDTLIDIAMQKRQQAIKTYKEDINGALLLITDAIDMFPNSAMFFNTRAIIFKFNGDFSLAIRDLILAEKRSQGNVPMSTIKMLAELYYDSQEFNEAIKYCKKYLAQESDQDIKQLLKDSEERYKIQTERQKQFEEQQTQKKQAEAEMAKKRKEEQTINNDIQAEIEKKYGDNPVYKSPLFQNLFSTAQNMNDQKAQELMSNQALMAAFNDPEFGRKIAEVAQDPRAGAKYMGDAQFMNAFQAVLGAFK